MKRYIIELLINLDKLSNIVLLTIWGMMMLSFWKDALHNNPISYGFVRGFWIILFTSVVLCLLLPSAKFWE